MENEVVNAEPVKAEEALVPVQKTNAAVRLGSGVLFTSIAEVWAVADNLRKGGAGPKGATTASIAASIIRGQSLGLDLVVSMGSVTVVNGRSSLMGDLALGLIRKSGKLAKYTREWVGVEGAEDFGCRITMKRADTGEEMVYTFTIADAQRAGLAGGGTWKAWLKRMLYYRALGFVARDLFSDILLGMYISEELQGSDYFDPDKKATATTLPTPVEVQGPDPFFAAPRAEPAPAEPAPAEPAPVEPQPEEPKALPPGPSEDVEDPFAGFRERTDSTEPYDVRGAREKEPAPVLPFDGEKKKGRKSNSQKPIW